VCLIAQTIVVTEAERELGNDQVVERRVEWQDLYVGMAGSNFSREGQEPVRRNFWRKKWL